MAEKYVATEMPPMRSATMNTTPAKIIDTSTALRRASVAFVGIDKIPLERSIRFPSSSLASPGAHRHSWAPQQAQSQAFDSNQTMAHHEWNVTTPPEVSPFVPVERTALVLTDVDPSTVSNRIAHFLRVHSITARYNKSSVECCITTEEACCLKFVIQLWTKNDQESENETETGHKRSHEDSSPPIILEVQRLHGCLLAMQDIRRRLYDAVKASHDRRPSMRACRRPSEQLRAEFSREHPSPDDGDAVSRCHRLLSQEQYQLGLRGLINISDPIANLSGGKIVAHAILYGTKQLGLGDSVWEIFYQLYEHEKEGDFANSMENHTGHRELREAHQLCLKLIVNVLDWFELHDDEHEAQTSYEPSLDWRTITEALIFDIESAISRPQDAALSIRSLKLLQERIPQAREALDVTSVTPLLQFAYAHGCAHHLSLEQEAQGWLRELGK